MSKPLRDRSPCGGGGGTGICGWSTRGGGDRGGDEAGCEGAESGGASSLRAGEGCPPRSAPCEDGGSEAGRSTEGGGGGGDDGREGGVGDAAGGCWVGVSRGGAP
jgi:hypothetical protein